MSGDVRFIARSQLTHPEGALVWKLAVADQLVEDCQDWSEPVQFKFEKRPDGVVEMYLRTVERMRGETA